MAPKIGLRFLHRHYLNADNSPMRFTVTAVRQGVVYYRADGESKAKEFCTLDRWPKIFAGTP